MKRGHRIVHGDISVAAGYFGEKFEGCIPERFGLKGKDAVKQLVAMFRTWDYSRMDFVCEVSTNRKAVYLNLLFWAQFDFTPFSLSQQQRDTTIERLRDAWDFNKIEIPLPTCH